MPFILTKRLQPLRGIIDLTALINVVLLLLFFFVLSSSFVLQPGVKVDPPHMAYAGGTPSSRLIVAVTYQNNGVDANGAALPRHPVFYFQDQIVTLDGLKSALNQLSLNRNSPPLVIKADREVPLTIITDLIDVANAHRPPLTVVIATQNTTPAP